MKQNLSRYYFLFPFLLGLLLYANTLGHGYTLDDNAAISNHSHVQAGLEGIPKILTTNFLNGLSGFNDGLYRPIPLISFAIEKELFDNNPLFSHLINILLNGFVGMLVFLFMKKLFFESRPHIALVIALLFVAHPVHTEVVAGIKGRDDVLSMLLLLSSGFLLFKAMQEGKIGLGALSLLLFSLSLCSKESAVSGVLVLPLFFWYSDKMEMKKVLWAFLLLMIIAVPWFLWRTYVINSMETGIDPGIFSNMNNSLADANGFSERLATAAFLQLLYIWKMVAPVVLIHDYSYNSIPVISLTDPKAIAGLLLVISLLTLSVLKTNSKNLYSSGIWWFFICIAPVANLLMLIGATFAERFLFMPSLGFSLISGLLLFKLVKDETSLFSFKQNPLFVSVFSLLMLFYSAQTFSRNKDWKDNEALFTADITKAENSCRTHYNYGTALFEKAKATENINEKSALLSSSIQHLIKAIEIYPNYVEAMNNLGSAYISAENYSKAIEVFNGILKIMPNYNKTFYNLGVAYEKSNMPFESAVNYLEYSKHYFPSLDVMFRSALMFGSAGRMDEAISVLTSIVQIEPNYAAAYLNLGQAYGMKGDLANAEIAFTKLLELEPNNLGAMEGLAVTKLNQGDKTSSVDLLKKILTIDPNNTRAQQILIGITQ